MKKNVKIFKIFFVIVFLYFSFLYILRLFEFPSDKYAESFWWLISLKNLQCRLDGGKVKGLGLMGNLYCYKKFSDGGKKCYSNKDCLSKKCVAGYWPEIFPELKTKISGNEISQDAFGKCSGNNLPECFSAEAVIEDNPRKVFFPPLCD